MRSSTRLPRQQSGGVITRINYGELAILFVLLLSLAGMATCAVGLKIEQRIQRDALTSKRTIFIPLVVIWGVSQVIFMAMVCIHLARTSPVSNQSFGPTHPVPYYILRTVGAVLVLTIAHFAISNPSTTGQAVEIFSWIPLFLCASAVVNAIVGNGANSNLLAVQGPGNSRQTNHTLGNDEERTTARPPAYSQSQPHPRRALQHSTAPPPQASSSTSSSQQQQQQQAPDNASSIVGAAQSYAGAYLHGFAEAAGQDTAQSLQT